MAEIDYYFTLVSPYAYLGHRLLVALAARQGALLRYRPVRLGKVFENSGGLPLAQRPRARQAYRFLELQRWREKRGLSFNLKPKFWPFDVTLADRFVIAVTAVRKDPDPFLRRAFAGIWGGPGFGGMLGATLAYTRTERRRHTGAQV